MADPTVEKIDTIIKKLGDLKPNSNPAADDARNRALEALNKLKTDPRDKEARKDLERAAEAMAREKADLDKRKVNAPVVAQLVTELGNASSQFPRIATEVAPEKMKGEVEAKIAALVKLAPNSNPAADAAKKKAIDALNVLKDKPDNMAARKDLDRATVQMQAELSNLKKRGVNAPTVEKLVGELQDINNKLPPQKPEPKMAPPAIPKADDTPAIPKADDVVQNRKYDLAGKAKEALAGATGMLGGFSQATTAPGQQVAKADPNKGKEPVNPLIQQTGKRTV